MKKICAFILTAVLLLGIFSSNDLQYQVPDYIVSGDILGAFAHTAAYTAKEVAIALGLIVLFFVILQLTVLKLPQKKLIQIAT